MPVPGADTVVDGPWSTATGSRAPGHGYGPWLRTTSTGGGDSHGSPATGGSPKATVGPTGHRPRATADFHGRRLRVTGGGLRLSGPVRGGMWATVKVAGGWDGRRSRDGCGGEGCRGLLPGAAGSGRGRLRWSGERRGGTARWREWRSSFRGLADRCAGRSSVRSLDPGRVRESDAARSGSRCLARVGRVGQGHSPELSYRLRLILNCRIGL